MFYIVNFLNLHNTFFPFTLLQQKLFFHLYNVRLFLTDKGNSANYKEKAMATHSSTLAWKIPWAEEPGRLQSTRSLRLGHNWVTSLSLFTFMHWRGNGNPFQCPCLENPRDGGAWWAAVYGVAQSRTQWSNLAAAAANYKIIAANYKISLLTSSDSVHNVWNPINLRLVKKQKNTLKVYIVNVK